MTLGLGAIFAAGLLTFVSPCVLPMVPIYLAALAGGDLESLGATQRRTLLTRAAAFALGLLAVFIGLGAAASSVGQLLADIRPYLQTFGAVLILLFGLKLLGVVEIPLLDRVVRVREPGRPHGLVGAALLGALFAAGWSPCVGPVLGSVLTLAAGHDDASATTGIAYLGVYGAGLALPLLVAAAFANRALRWLRRARPWVRRAERVLGAGLAVVAISLLIDLVPGAPLAPNPTTVAQSAPAAQTPTLLVLHSADCPVCQGMAPVVERIRSHCTGHGVQIQTVDVSRPENRNWAMTYRVIGVPTFIYLDAQGREAARLVGKQSEDALLQGLAATAGFACPGIGPVPPPVEVPAPGSPATACALGAEAGAPSCDAPL